MIAALSATRAPASISCPPEDHARTGHDTAKARGRARLRVSMQCAWALQLYSKAEPCASCMHACVRAGRSVRSAQPITDAGFGQDVLRAFGIRLDLLPELPNVDSEVLGVGQLVPELAEQELMGQHLAGMLHERAQELVLLGRKPYVLFAELDQPADEVDRELADPKDRPLA